MAIAVHATDTVSPGNPYALIVARNVFGLNPPPPPGPAVPAEPPPKITPNGIMSIFGSLQALFKVSVTVPGKPPTEKSYMLSEGQREDDIEVTKIDEKNAIITFDNHGTVQELPLANGQASSGPAPAMAGGMPPRPNMGSFVRNRFAGNPAFNNATAFRNRAAGENGAPPNNGQNFGGGFENSGSRVYNPGNEQSSQMSPEQQAALIALEHLKAQEQGSPSAPLFPPTSIDKEAGIRP